MHPPRPSKVPSWQGDGELPPENPLIEEHLGIDVDGGKAREVVAPH